MRLLLDRTIMKSSRNTGTASGAMGMLRFGGRGPQAAEVFIELLNVDVDAPNEQTPILVGPNSPCIHPLSLRASGRWNVPAATAVGLARLWGPDTAMTASYLDLSGVRDLPVGVPFGTSLAGSTGVMTYKTRPRFPKQHINWTTGSAAVSNEVASPINLHHAFPASVTPVGHAEQQNVNKGGTADASLHSITTTQVRPRIDEKGGGTMAAASTLVVSFVE